MAGEGTMSIDVGLNGNLNKNRRARKDTDKAEKVDRLRGGKARPERVPPESPPKGRKNK